MMCELLKDWLKDFDQDIERQHRKVLFLLDNCSAQKVSIMPKAARFVLLWQNELLLYGHWTRAPSGLPSAILEAFGGAACF